MLSSIQNEPDQDTKIPEEGPWVLLEKNLSKKELILLTYLITKELEEEYGEQQKIIQEWRFEHSKSAEIIENMRTLVLDASFSGIPWHQHLEGKYCRMITNIRTRLYESFHKKIEKHRQKNYTSLF